jgi:iron complex transport system ATP-binding protein
MVRAPIVLWVILRHMRALEICVRETILEASNLSIGHTLAHGAARAVATGVNIVVRRGELVSLLGPDGTCKSTLLRTLSGLQPPLAGRVMLDEHDLHRLTPRERARRLGVVLTIV